MGFYEFHALDADVGLTNSFKCHKESFENLYLCYP